MQKIKCKICGNEEVQKWCEKYWYCERCEYVWLDEKEYISPEAEKERYEQHENNAENEGYVKMLEGFLGEVGEIRGKKVLDFGCGANPVLAELMRKNGAEVEVFDKYFYAENNFADRKYDLITLTEVFEHLHEPVGTLMELKECLAENGKIALMTKLWSGDEEDFAKWWYRRDVTHVGFLARESVKMLAEKLEMRMGKCEGDVVILGK